MALAVRTEAGWRLVPKLGLYLHGGYTFVGLGGSATAEELVEAYAGVDLPEASRLGDLDRQFRASAALHLLGAEVGWDQKLWRSLHLRAAVGWSFTVASRTAIGPDFEPVPLAAPAYEEAGAAASDELDDTFQGYAHPPTFTLALGWRFGA